MEKEKEKEQEKKKKKEKPFIPRLNLTKYVLDTNNVENEYENVNFDIGND